MEGIDIVEDLLIHCLFACLLLVFVYLKAFSTIVMKLKLEGAEDKKSRLVLEKLDTDESKRMAHKEIADLNHQMGQRQEEVNETKRGIQVSYSPVHCQSRIYTHSTKIRSRQLMGDDSFR